MGNSSSTTNQKNEAAPIPYKQQIENLFKVT